MNNQYPPHQLEQKLIYKTNIISKLLVAQKIVHALIKKKINLFQKFLLSV